MAKIILLEVGGDGEIEIRGGRRVWLRAKNGGLSIVIKNGLAVMGGYYKML